MSTSDGEGEALLGVVRASERWSCAFASCGSRARLRRQARAWVGAPLIVSSPPSWYAAAAVQHVKR